MSSEEKTPKSVNGGRNLVLLGFIAIALATISTAVSVYIYQVSGDIYIDRSRPGFLPDDTEISPIGSDSSSYTFSEDGSITHDVLDEYLQRFNETVNPLSEPGIVDAFSSDALSDDALGIEN
jgi:hypothetical protein